MAFTFGAFSEFDDSVTIGDPTIAVAAKAIKLAYNKGAFYQAMGAPQVAIDTSDFEVYSRSKTTKNGTLGADWTSSATADLDIDSTSIKGLTVGHVLEVGTERVIVKVADKTANTIDVYARGAGGTTAATHTDGDAFTVVGFAGKDSTLKDVESVSESTGKYTNYVQTVYETLDWELKGGILRRKGLGSSQITTILSTEAATRVAEYLATMSINSYKQEGSATGNPYMSAGLLQQLADTAGGSRSPLSYNSNGAFTETKLRAALKEVTNNGLPTDIWVNPTNRETMNGFNASFTTTIPRTEHTAGQYVDTYDYDGLLLNIRTDADLPTSTVPIVNQSKCMKGWLQGDGLRKEIEPPQSSREHRESLQGSVGFIIEDVGQEHTYVYGIT